MLNDQFKARPSLGALIVVSIFGLFPFAARAAGQATTAAIAGVITDSSGAILPGVTVTATGPALQVPQVIVVTDARGEYRLSPLPTGTYTVTYEFPGFQILRRENVRLPVGFVATVDQALSPGTVQETVTVMGASPVVDVTNPATSVDLSSDSLELLPTNRDGLKAFMGQVPGIVYRVVATHLIKKAGYTKTTAHTGAVTLIQRFGSALNLNHAGVRLRQFYIRTLSLEPW